MPKRIQRKRTKGWRMPEGAVYVGRPSKWGNPWTPKNAIVILSRAPWTSRPATIPECIDMYREDISNGEIGIFVADIRRELAGKDLCCWCNPFDPCHADVLLEIANGVE